MAERSPSIVWRILRLHFAALVLTAIVIPLAVNLLLTLDAQTLQRRALDLRAAELIRAVEKPPSGPWRLTLPQKQVSLYEQSSGGYVFAVVNAAGAPLFAAPTGLAPQFLQAPRGNRPTYFSKKVGPAVYAGLSRPVDRGQERVWVIVGQDLENPDVIIDDVVARFLLRTALLTTPLLIILLSVDVIGLRRVFRPVLEASAFASTIRPGQPRQRLPTQGLPREVLPLATSMNDALTRLQAGYDAQREFNANVAHELRTPLAVLRLQAEGLQEAAARETILSAVGAMSRTVGQLLEMAQLDTDLREANQTCDLAEVARAVTADLAPYALERGRELGLSCGEDSVPIVGDAGFIGVAMRNLIENAVLHAHGSTIIDVVVSPDGSIRVEDDGRGLDPKHWPVVFDRFWRGPDSAGAGIGLSIVKRIVEAFRGAIDVGRSAKGGARFTLRFIRLDEPEGPLPRA